MATVTFVATTSINCLINPKKPLIKNFLGLHNYALPIDEIGGGDRTRTRYLLLAKQPLYQVSYTPDS